jgi:hypothetical protein
MALSVILLALAGCGSGSEDIVPYQQTGPGRIAGRLVFSAPSVEFRTLSPDASLDSSIDAVITLPGEFTLHADGEYWRTRALWQQDPVVPGVAQPDPWTSLPQTVIPGRTEIDFDFRSLPFAKYRMGFSAGRNVGLSDPSVVFVQPQTFSLSAETPEERDVEYVWGSMGSGTEGARLRGRICLSGNDSSELSLQLYELGTPVDSNQIVQPGLSWQAVAPGSTYGRVFFEIEGLAPGSYKTRWFESPGQAGDSLWQENEDNPAKSPALQLLDVQPDSDYAGLVCYGSREAYPGDEPGRPADYSLRHRGILELELRLANLPDLSQDTLVVAEATGDAAGPNRRAWNYIVPSHFNAEGVAHYRLLRLKDGPYRLRLLRLGPDNLSEPEVLAERAEPATVVYPHAEPIEGETWDPFAPYGSVVWELEL